MGRTVSETTRYEHIKEMVKEAWLVFSCGPWNGSLADSMLHRAERKVPASIGTKIQSKTSNPVESTSDFLYTSC